jgi:hypothetical protein
MVLKVDNDVEMDLGDKIIICGYGIPRLKNACWWLRKLITRNHHRRDNLQLESLYHISTNIVATLQEKHLKHPA